MADSWHRGIFPKNGATAEHLFDGSFQIGGANPDQDIYKLNFSLPPQRITHFQIEAIPGDQGGPGRAGNGNFVLS